MTKEHNDTVEFVIGVLDALDASPATNIQIEIGSSSNTPFEFLTIRYNKHQIPNAAAPKAQA